MFENDGGRRGMRMGVDSLGAGDARIFSLVDIGERSGMGLSSLYGVWERQKYADPAIAQEYEPDRTKVVVEFESEASEVAEKVAENSVEVTEKVAGNRRPKPAETML